MGLKIKSKFNKTICFLISTLLVLCGAILLVLFFDQKEYYGSGNDMWGHLFKAEYLYDAMKNGVFYPLYTPYWYNGLQLFRYWPALSYYALASLMFVTGGSVTGALILFGGVSFFVGGLGWVIWGYVEKRPVLGTVIGLIWFILPDNYRVYLNEGNLPRMFIAMLLPYLGMSIRLYVHYRKNYALALICMIMTLTTLSHVMTAAIMGIATFMYLFFNAIETKTWYRQMMVLVMELCSYLVSGIILYPSLKGGIVAMSSGSGSGQISEIIAQSLLQTFNFQNRFNSDGGIFYFGLSLLFLIILGIFFAPKTKRAGYFMALIVILFTTPFGTKILLELPLGSLLWMRRFSTIAAVFIFASFFEWKNIRRFVCVIVMSLIIIDCACSVVTTDGIYSNLSDDVEEDFLYAKSITSQRVALLDLSHYGPAPSYLTYEGEPVMYSFGWAWQGAATADNIMLLNTALQIKQYTYMFDRSLELGNDVVVVSKECADDGFPNVEEMVRAAKKVGYELVYESERNVIFKYKTEYETFALATTYYGAAIGEYADEISMAYTSFEALKETNIEKYTIEELSHYKSIILSGATYTHREKAEEMVKELSDRGIIVVIDMNHIPADPVNRIMSFLGVTAPRVVFTNNFPVMHFGEKEIMTNDFTNDVIWNTVYLSGYEKEQGVASYSGQDICFCASTENEKIWFIGFNLIFYANETNDRNVYEMINSITGTDREAVPQRIPVPMKLKVGYDRIIIDTEIPGVNTTLAYQDNFVGENISEDDNLLVVNSTHVEIKMIYPYFKQGLAMSIFGVLLAMAIMFLSPKVEAKIERQSLETGGEETA